ncbi:hypothetical protein K491DRAFT_722827 [Lophiostoma macrostomum CBS 122681]|uniref:Uncharacterized protein n=1 Tax=Lophiostoma macrostomum CBS 122681 TaxID=1314788 RepID=A0A6A6SPQ0_9PLEO|nr:hypothetical protein K491DRAFT_722827 [Lophiostoma macrostomum CBS 122681]
MAETASQGQRKSLFDLPSELRIEIYGYLLPQEPQNFPLAYEGVRLAGRQVKEEFDHEIIKHLQTYARRLAKSVSSLEASQFRPANIETYYQSRNLEFTIPDAFWTNKRVQKFVEHQFGNCENRHSTMAGHVLSLTFHISSDASFLTKALPRAVQDFIREVNHYFVDIEDCMYGYRTAVRSEQFDSVKIVFHQGYLDTIRKAIDENILNMGEPCLRRIETSQPTSLVWARRR